MSPNIIASGSYKGEIFLWNLDSHKLLKKMYSSVGDQMIEREGKLYICILSFNYLFLDISRSLNSRSTSSNSELFESRLSLAEMETKIELKKKRRMSKWDGFYTGTASLGYLNEDYTYSVENVS